MTLAEFIKLPKVEVAFEDHDGDTIWELVGNYGLEKDFANLLVTQNMFDNFLKEITVIPNGAFAHCELLEVVNIPDSVTEIGYYAFSDCKSLKSVTIPDSDIRIKSNAFADCVSLESINIPESFEDEIEDIFTDVDLDEVEITYI